MSPTGMHPVQQVNWNDASMFCNWLSSQEGLERCYKQIEKTGKWQLIPDTDGYRLPNDAEWEYACRAGTRTRFACGNAAEFLEDYAVYAKEEFTKPGGSKLCNAWGIFDMHGNVWEWVNDCPTVATDGPAAANRRYLRGGSRGV
jgi:formylglycine-generating enzyme required for sulfatase activity